MTGLRFAGLLLCGLLAGCVSDRGTIAPGALTVTWDEAVEMLTSQPRAVESVFQTHSLAVFFYMKDGRTFETVEPRIDLIFDLVDDCRAPCAHIQMVTE